jgi:hypothetical protein
MHDLTVANLSGNVTALLPGEAACAEDRQQRRHTSRQGPTPDLRGGKDFELMEKLLLWIASILWKMHQTVCKSGLLALAA